MKLIVGLGNPGEKYRHTLHNVGFAAVDALADEVATGQWTSRFKGLVSQGRYQGFPYILLKPQTYMNVSGESVVACKQFYKLELEDILVISDDIDRIAGLLRYRSSGGHGGHNGLRSIIQLCGANRFHRLKIGIGRPDSSNGVSNYVLSKPSSEIRQPIDEAVRQTVEYQLDFIRDIPIQIQS
ncbi:MAG: aminoacyl-tRNA hydrolase [Proteobacteria bacterium]|nr:aminoacyl-tRNA hydrolase [Pseudomonadota bacterium]